MKKIFSSAVSALTAIACTLLTNAAVSFAEAINIENKEFCGECEEIIFGDAEDISLILPDSPKIKSNYNGKTFNYKDSLAGNNLSVYNALTVWETPSLDEITVKLPDTINISLSALPGSANYTAEDEEIFREAVFGNCKAGIDSVFFDMPEIFWLNQSELTIGIGSASYRHSAITGKYNFQITSLTFTPALDPAFGSIEKAMEYKGKLEAAVADFDSSGDNLYDRIKSIHDNISFFTFYDETADFMSSAVSALIEPGSVCEGYSEGFKLICDSLDIPCVSVLGNFDLESNIAHMWNYVQMDDGKWYAVDVTWDDLDDVNNGVKYQYFLKGSKSFFTNHTETPEYLFADFKYPELSAEDYTVNQTEPVTTASTSETTTTTTTTSSSTTSNAETTTSASETTSVQTSATTSSTTTKASTTSASESEVTSTTTETIAVEYERGDFNHDGYVNIADLVTCAKAVHGVKTEYPCDYDGDMIIDIYDLTMMRERLFIR